MAFTLVETKENYIDGLGTYIKGASYYLCDSEDDVANLPTSRNIGIGSRALVIPTGHIYMFGPSREWLLYKGVSIMN